MFGGTGTGKGSIQETIQSSVGTQKDTTKLSSDCSWRGLARAGPLSNICLIAMLCSGQRERERERERERRERERERERERDRETERQRDRETETDRDRQRQTETDRQTDRQTDREREM